MDRAEKSQAETSAKLAKTAEALDRQHRPAGNGAPDTTGAISGTAGERTAALSDPKRPGSSAQTAILDGWVLRDVYNGAAMTQYVKASTVDFGGASFRDWDFMLGPDYFFEGGVSGLLGVNVLKSFDVDIDLEVRDARHLTNIAAALRACPPIETVERARG